MWRPVGEVEVDRGGEEIRGGWSTSCVRYRVGPVDECVSHTLIKVAPSPRSSGEAHLARTRSEKIRVVCSLSDKMEQQTRGQLPSRHALAP